MSKITKAQNRNHEAACALLQKETLTMDERRFVLDHWRADAAHDVTRIGAYFTPRGLAEAVAQECHGADRVIDLCAGIGALAFARWERDRPSRLVCVERDPVYAVVGRKVLPEAEWIVADVFSLVQRKDLGAFDLAVSNPPYGRLKRTSGGPRYRGGLFEYHVIDVASHLAEQGVFLIPQTSSPCRFSGAAAQRGDWIESEDCIRFRQETGIDLDLGLGIDTSAWTHDWHGVKPTVESVRVDFGWKR
ncbi:methyltransferase [Dyella psychrodurans]|uniref:Methyltransferase n=1 Tax=Dyella psychrodurans TaxID=1927960 RepID=A0A370XBY5_9GAMM|nr:methyltransferase [Dyella psychrodurans]RDS85919.1 methyltransferase [Dyella psychrodurans]